MKKITAFILSLAMLLAFVPAATAVHAENYTYRTVFDADTSDGTNFKVGANMAVSLVDSTLSGGTKVLQARRTGDWNGCSAFVTDDFRSYAKDAIGIRLWVAGNENAVNNNKNFSLGFRSVGSSTVWKIDNEYSNRYAVTAEGQTYTLMFSSLTNVYSSGTDLIAGYIPTNASTIFTKSFLGKLNAIFIGRGVYGSGDAAAKPTYYIDDVQLIFPENHTYSPLEYKASFAGTETAVLSAPVDDILSDVNNNDAVELPNATLTDGEFAGWTLESAPNTILAAGTTVNLTGDTAYYAVSASRPKIQAPAAPQISVAEGNSVTLVSQGTDIMYKVDDGAWQTSNIFNNLAGGVEYTFYAKRVGNIAYADSDASEGTRVTTPLVFTFQAENTCTGYGNCTTDNYPATDGIPATYHQINSPRANTWAKYTFTGMAPGYYSIIIHSRNVRHTNEAQNNGRSSFNLSISDETGEAQDFGVIDFADQTYLISGATYHCATPLSKNAAVTQGSTLELRFDMNALKNTGMQLDKFIVTKVADYNPVVKAVKTQAEASIRLGTVCGMRFYTTIDESFIPEDATTVTKGTLIAPADLIVGELTHESGENNFADVEYKAADYYEPNTIVGSIVNIKPANYNREFIARGYICVDGVYYYSSTTSSRTVSDIADAYIADETSSYNSLDPAIKALVDTWAAAND